MKKLRAAIVGCGGIHSSHSLTLAEMDNVEISAFCDIVIEKATTSAKKHGSIAFKDFDSLMDYNEFDVLHICTPHHLHADMAIRAMESGKHVLCEKPMAISYEDALRVSKVAKANNVKYGVCFQNRYNESTVFVRDLLSSGKLGKIKGARAMVTWDRNENYYKSTNWRGRLAGEGGGVLINQTIHTLDLLQWLIGKPLVDLRASISTKRLESLVETEDTADLFLKFDDDIRAVFFASLAYTENSPVFLEFSCENGRITMGDDIRVCYKGEEAACYDINHPRGERAYWGRGHAKLIADFYDCILHDKPFLIDADEGAISIEIIDKAYKLAR